MAGIFPNHQFITRFLLFVLSVTLATACSSPEPPSDDLGAFMPMDVAGQHDIVAVDAGAVWTQFCKSNEGGKYQILLISGMVLELTPEDQYGVPFPGVTVDFYDYCSVKVASAISGEDGSFSFQIDVGHKGFDGYSEYTLPEQPPGCTGSQCEVDGYPLFRQFDKRYVGDFNVTMYRMVSGLIFEAPMSMLGQKGHLGFVQGSVYNLVGGKEVAQAVVESSSGTVTYLSDNLPVPDEKLVTTQSRGVFFVYNATPGQIMLTAALPDGRVLEKPVIVWPVNSHPRKTITVVGFPVYPGLDVTIPE